MKIKPKSLEIQGDISNVHSNAKEINDRKTGQARADEVRSDRARDSVAVSNLGSALHASMNPSNLAEERRARIEALKAQIKEGTYRPPLEDVARAVAEEISYEVLAGANFSDE